MKKKVSIIIPIYNGERFIKECLESIIRQTYKNYEIIIIDDGSEDNSFFIISEYQKKIKNLHIFRQKNEGVSNARNKGIKCATGDFITFVDADDTLNSDFLEKLAEKIENNDVLVSGYNRISEEGKKIGENIPKNNPWNEMKLCNVAGKLYRRTFLINNHIKYANQKYAEDLNFYLQAYNNTKRITFYSYAGYNYRKVNGSATSNLVARDLHECVTSIYLMDDLFKNGTAKRLEDIKTKKMVMYLYQKTIPFFIITKRKLVDYKELYKETIEAFSVLKKIYLKHNTKIKFRFQKQEQLSINIAINLFVLCYKLHILMPLLWLLCKI